MLAGVVFAIGMLAASPPARGPSVVLLTLDTTRADALGCYGNRDAKTPHLDALAARGTRYARAFTPSPLTFPAHCSLLTGLDPPFHGVRDNGTAVLPASLPTLATVLTARGYVTAAFVSSRVLDRRFGLARGFQTYGPTRPRSRCSRPCHPTIRSQRTTRAASTPTCRSELGLIGWPRPTAGPSFSATTGDYTPRMPKVRLERWEESDGPPTETRLMRLMESEGYEVASYAYREGTVFPAHEHAHDKCDAVLEGVLRVTAGSDVYDLGPGDRLYLPAGTRHAAEVVGGRTVVSLDGTRW